ncbi:hypothetical protein J5N97_020835 [Dioscorea zingiberensis]|uniref:Uncharacterized protein n=1 Tax=Dioscorea zingiberensis TaxID=325984 RepID=A0A9D5CGI4_9LILI|nr:hypothetical protein J5N97_020835 [Dioscorea zingiberensis]
MMEYIPLFMFFYLFNPVSSLTSGHQVPSILEFDKDNKIQTYIVHLAQPEGTGFLGDEELEKWHESFLPNSTLDSGEPRLVYSYSEVMTGFAARLTAHEVEAMQHMDGFLHAKPDVEHELETTYTPQFLGLSQANGTWEKYSNMGEGITIGVIDSGIPRHHPSFSDDKMPAKKANWKGTCSFSNFTCNNKIIGAVTFASGKKKTPPVDTGGHGSHVASIAAGNFVNDALDLGKFKYKASGMAPRAHLAIYKVCPNCSDSDIIATFESRPSKMECILSTFQWVASRGEVLQ